MNKVLKNNLTITALLFFCFSVLFMVLPASGEAATPQISAGGFHTMALKSDGSLWAWGPNSRGALGDGTTVDKLSPVQITADTDWVSISAGGFHTMALKSDGSLWAWGANATGALGDGTTGDKLSPVQIGADTDWVSISAGGTI